MCAKLKSKDTDNNSNSNSDVKITKESESLTDYTKKCMVDYGKYTLQDRAIPELKDGLKPIHRRLVWTGYTGGYSYSGPTKKCAKIVGECLGNYSPNGDQPVYGALVTLATSANPLFIPQGNFGCKPTGDDEASMRYTEAKLSLLSEKYLLDKDYIAVTPMVPNYDGTKEEPIYLPAKIPVILTQGIEGIATGASTNIPSFSLESVRELTLTALKKKKCTSKMCLDILEFKFADGGKVYSNSSDILSMFETGEGKIFVAPTYEYEKKTHSVVLTSYSPRLKLDKVFAQSLKIPGVSDIENQTGTKNKSAQIRLVFKLKKEADAKKSVKEIIQSVGCSLPFSIMITDRKDNGDTEFRYTSIPNIVNDWISWRLNFEVKVVNRLIEIEKEKIQRWNWLLWAIDHLELIFKALKTTDPDGYLIKKGKITEEHAKYILDQQTRRLSKLSGDELKAKVKASKKIVVELKNDISNKDNISKRVIKGLKELS